MKKLNNTLYITTPGVYLSLDGENIVLFQEKTEINRRPLINIDSIVVFGFLGISPALMGKCVHDGIALSFLSMNGRFLARVTGEAHGNVLLRKSQYRLSDNETDSVKIANNFVIGKIYNCRQVIRRATRDYPMRLDTEKMNNISTFLMNSMNNARKCDNLGVLRGIEGEAAAIYFSALNDLILQQKEIFFFLERSKHPALDAFNALLSYVYTLLLHECAAALETVGLDSYVGFLHRDRPGRMSLACDLMEELRALYADRFALTLINKQIISGNNFIYKEDGVVIMDDEVKKTILRHWQLRKSEIITHPYLNEKIEWGLIPYVQALLLSRYIRGDIDGYPPFLYN